MRIPAEVDEFKGKYEKQVRRTEDVRDHMSRQTSTFLSTLM
ncbi:MAG: hypothetical protein ACREO5_15385 [Candidatus Binatia bacterium]